MCLQCVCAVPAFSEVGIPATAKAGQPIPVSVRLSPDDGAERVWIYYRNPAEDLYTNRSMEWNGTLGAWTHEIPAQNWKGVVEWQVTARDSTGNSAQYPASGYGEIEILGKSPPKPLPWNFIIMIAFLGVVLVLTELAYKPGVYRKTGRERARELEERDRESEEEL